MTNQLHKFWNVSRNEQCFVTRRRSKRFRRCGVAAVETAVILPVVLMIVFGAIELANGIFTKQSLAMAAYEGARAVTKKNANENLGRQRISEVLQSKGISGASVSISPAITSTTPRGTKVTVTVRCGNQADSVVPVRFLTNSTFEESVVMIRM